MMSSELQLLADIWETVKPYLPPKDRLSVADTIVKHFDEQLFIEADSDIMSHISDRVLRVAISSHFDVLEDDDDGDDDE